MTAVEALGVEPNRNSANWMVKVGTEEHHIILAGCQIHYCVSCPDRPNQGDTSQIFTEDKGEATVRSNQIYIPEPPAQKDVEMVDGKEVEWLTDRDILIDILAKNPQFFENSMHRESIVNVVSNNDFTKFRFYRPIYGINIVLEIMHKNGNLIGLGIY